MRRAPSSSGVSTDGIETGLTSEQCDAIDRPRERRGWGVGQPSGAVEDLQRSSQATQLRQSRIYTLLAAIGLLILLWLPDAHAAPAFGSAQATAVEGFRIRIPERLTAMPTGDAEAPGRGTQLVKERCLNGSPRINMNWP